MLAGFYDFFLRFITKERMFPCIRFENYTAARINTVGYDAVCSLVGEYQRFGDT
jgi:hypothetical protein